MTPDFGEIMHAMRSDLMFASAGQARRRSKAHPPRRPRPRPTEALHRARPQSQTSFAEDNSGCGVRASFCVDIRFEREAKHVFFSFVFVVRK